MSVVVVPSTLKLDAFTAVPLVLKKFEMGNALSHKLKM